MTKTKNFKKDNPALNFMTIQEEPAQEEEAGKVKDTSLQLQGQQLKAPEGYKINPLYIETKSKRVQLLMQPSLVTAVKELAKEKGVSMNELVSVALKEYLTKEGKEHGEY